jgi:hypothetical protein
MANISQDGFGWGTGSGSKGTDEEKGGGGATRLKSGPPAIEGISGLGSRLKDIFKGGAKSIHSKTDKPEPRDIQPMYKFNETLDKRLLGLADYYYREGSFEKIQFARKWMRNALIFQGYHELEWSEINVAWDVVLQDSGDYAFPNNYYRTLIQHGIKAYVKNAPIIEPVPSNDDADAQAAAKAARTALEIIKRSVGYDYIRVIEAQNLHLFGNSFRFNYYSKDSRYGFVTQPVYEDSDVVMSPPGSVCQQCGPMEGQFDLCPQCGGPISEHTPAVVSKLPFQMGTVRYPKGEVITEIVNPLEIYIRNSAYSLRFAPFIIRNRVVDRLALQAAHPDIQLAPRGDEGGGEAYSVGGDLGLIYLQSLSDLPGDPTQYAAWYERATASAKALLVEAWIRPSAYFFDKELIKLFPDGVYIRKTGDTLLEAVPDTIEDHWTHYVYTPVPGRIWGDGNDDLIPGQLKLDETDRLIQRNQGYNSAPLLVINSQMIDKTEILNDPSTIIESRSGGRPISDNFAQIKSSPLSQETWQWREAQKFDMSFHSRFSPSQAGQHQPGVNTFGGQESMAAKSEDALFQNLMLWKSSDENWARQVLKLASENWMDERIHAVSGINGRWEFEKLRGAALDLDKFTIVARVSPVDPTQQDAFSQAVASGALDPQDPRVKRKMMELFHLPLELDSFYDDAKVQWKEIEQMKQSLAKLPPGQFDQAQQQRQMMAQMAQATGGQAPPMPLPGQIQPEMVVDNDAVHIDICRSFCNSDESKDNPQLRQLVKDHAQLHIVNMLRQGQMQAVIQGAQQQEQQQPGAPQSGPSKPNGKEKPQSGKNGGQTPQNPITRQQRAEKGAAAKGHRPQPSSGNQHHVQRLT